MSNVLLGLIGVILFIGLALAGATYFGSQLSDTKIDAKAADMINQSSQIAHAIEAYAADNGRLPYDGVRQPAEILLETRYLKRIPPGGASQWSYDGEVRALLTPAEGSQSEGLRICVAARKKSSIPNPENILKCDGSTGQLSRKDPCCLM